MARVQPKGVPSQERDDGLKEKMIADGALVPHAPDRMRFAIHLMQRTSLIYLRFLKDIIRRSDVIEHRLQQSMRNEELIELLGIDGRRLPT